MASDSAGHKNVITANNFSHNTTNKKHHHIHHPLTFDKDDEERIQSLFEQMDVNKDGRIDVKELSEGLKRLGIHHTPNQAEQIMEIGDVTDDDHLSFDEFLKYCHDHEQKLWLVFKSMDTSNSGNITREELEAAFENLGVHVTKQEVDHLLKKMDTDGSLKIEWDEWREFHLLNPHALNIKDILKFWKHSTFIDIGDALAVPDDFTAEEKKSGMWWRQLVSGGLAGVVSRTCTAPLDRLKILLQVQANTNWGILRGFQKMLSEGGVKSMWRGNFTNCVKIAPESAIKFFCYEKAKRLLVGAEFDNKDIGMANRFLAGSTAGIIAQTSIYPMEVMKTRLAIGRTGQYKNFIDCARTVYLRDGLKGFYRGLVPGLIGVVPYAGIDLCVYETLKVNWLKSHEAEVDPGVFVLLFCGTVASTCGQISSYPLALIRTKLQAQTSDPKFKGVRANGMVDMFKLIVKEHGIFGLYRGIVPNFLKVAPAVSISYVVYERVRKKLGMT